MWLRWMFYQVVSSQINMRLHVCSASGQNPIHASFKLQFVHATSLSPPTATPSVAALILATHDFAFFISHRSKLGWSQVHGCFMNAWTGGCGGWRDKEGHKSKCPLVTDIRTSNNNNIHYVWKIMQNVGSYQNWLCSLSLCKHRSNISFGCMVQSPDWC